MTTPATIAAATAAILDAARQGDRVVLVPAGDSLRPRNLWPGLGNRSGLHGFISDLLHEKWAKGGARLTRKLAGLPDGARVEVHRYQPIDRDRGRWRTVRTFTL